MDEVSIGETITIDAQIAALKKGMERLKRLNRLQRSLTAPVTKLPVELLGYIFDFYVEMQETPWLLVLVSPLWRRIALSMSRLWRYIWVTNGTRIGNQREWDVGGDIGRVTSVGQYTKCVTEAELVQVLALSGAVSLHVYLTLRKHRDRREQSIDNDLLSQLLGLPTSNRIEEIHLLIGGSGDFLPAPLSFYIETSYPRLKSLTIGNEGSPWDTNFIRKILSSSELSSLKFNSAIPWEIALPLRWTSVRHLTLPPYGLTIHTLNALCAKIQNIQTLKAIPSGWPNESTPQMTFKLLEELDIRCETSQLHHLNLPSLTKLNLTALKGLIPNVYPSWALPVLSEFRASLTSEEIAKFLPSITMPKLHTLTLDILGSLLEPFPAVTYPTVRSIDLTCLASANYVTDALNAVPNSRKVVLSLYDSSDEIVWEILTRLTDTTHMVSPMAIEVHFVTQEKCLSIPNASILSLFRSCVARRKAISHRPFKIVFTTSSPDTGRISTEIFS
ncbi:hypothetical protein FRB91_003365 [Serendipita sp. 411]|nr:hypothetical protein FRB91_003365 [Serendipita sp. 411]